MPSRPGVRRFHARQPIINNGRIPDWRQWLYTVVYYGAHHPLYFDVTLKIMLHSALP